MQERDIGPQLFWSPDKPSSAGAGTGSERDDEDPKDKLRSVTEVAEATGYSSARVSTLVKTGQIPGHLEARRGPGRVGRRGYLTTIRAIEDYVANQPRIGEVARRAAAARYRKYSSS